MEFAAPEPTIDFWLYFVLPLSILAVGSLSIFIAWKRKINVDNDFWGGFVPFITVLASLLSVFTLMISGEVMYNNRGIAALHNADNRVTLNSNPPTTAVGLFADASEFGSQLPHRKNQLARVQLIVTDSLQTLNCNALLVENTYRLSCDNPTGGDITVSVDEALKVIDSKTPVAESN